MAQTGSQFKLACSSRSRGALQRFKTGAPQLQQQAVMRQTPSSIFLELIFHRESP
jgi:hypothetical protein